MLSLSARRIVASELSSALASMCTVPVAAAPLYVPAHKQRRTHGERMFTLVDGAGNCAPKDPGVPRPFSEHSRRGVEDVGRFRRVSHLFRGAHRLSQTVYRYRQESRSRLRRCNSRSGSRNGAGVLFPCQGRLALDPPGPSYYSTHPGPGRGLRRASVLPPRARLLGCPTRCAPHTGLGLRR